jgi:hypothetical protein
MEDMSIFAKKDPNDKKKENNKQMEKKILIKDEVIKLIPEDAKNEEDKELAKSMIELRWRIFKFPDFENEIIEMSEKKPNQERMYRSKNGEWILYDDNGKYDPYIVEKYYYYGGDSKEFL